MYQEGGFGKRWKGNRPFPLREDPALLLPMACLVGLLLGWPAFFLLGLKAGLGWYGWPLGCFILPLGLLALRRLALRLKT